MIFENFILPISGVDFVRYIAIFSMLSEYGIKPAKIYCASGGCLAAYLGMMSSFTSNVELWNFDSNMFVKRPTPITPMLLTFAIRGYLYHRQNIDNFTKKNFIPSKLLDVEIITGYFETKDNSNRIVLTTNYPRSRSSLSEDNITNIGTNMCLKHPKSESDFANRIDYLDYLMDFCIDSVSKTSNIPYLVNAIGDEKSVDFGVVSPSPMIYANAEINKCIFFSPIDIDDLTSDSMYQIFFHNLILKDVYCLKQNYPNMIKKDNFQDVIDFLEDKSHYFIVIYTRNKVNLNILKFTFTDYHKAIQDCKSEIKTLIFY